MNVSQASKAATISVDPVSSAVHPLDTPKPGQTAFVHYIGKLLNGTVFTKSRGVMSGYSYTPAVSATDCMSRMFESGGAPLSFTIGAGQVIQAFDECVLTMQKKEIVVILVLPKYAYGENGVPGNVPANSPLMFEVELTDFK
jgi:FKBP-type peptidyl-prolyl cis-trans isomerase